MPLRLVVPCWESPTLCNPQSVRLAVHNFSRELKKVSEGTIRGDYALTVPRNVCHGSDTVESAEREIAL